MVIILMTLGVIMSLQYPCHSNQMHTVMMKAILLFAVRSLEWLAKRKNSPL